MKHLHGICTVVAVLGLGFALTGCSSEVQVITVDLILTLPRVNGSNVSLGTVLGRPSLSAYSSVDGGTQSGSFFADDDDLTALYTESTDSYDLSTYPGSTLSFSVAYWTYYYSSSNPTAPVEYVFTVIWDGTSYTRTIDVTHDLNASDYTTSYNLNFTSVGGLEFTAVLDMTIAEYQSAS